METLTSTADMITVVALTSGVHALTGLALVEGERYTIPGNIAGAEIFRVADEEEI